MNIKPKVLVVDDVEANLDLLEQSLKLKDYDVVRALNGKIALQVVEQESLDLILLDKNMPVCDGFDTLQEVRKKYTAFELPVILLTASNEIEDVVKGLKLGANDFISKPINITVLLARINTQLRLKEVQDNLSESVERFNLATEGVRDGIWDYDIEADKLFLSNRWKNMLGYEEDEFESTFEHWKEQIFEEDLLKFETLFEDHCAGNYEYFECKYKVKHKDGGYRWVFTRGKCITGNHGKALRIVGSQSDITETMLYDSVTNLPNETLLLDRVKHEINTCKVNKGMFAVIVITFDNMQHYANTYDLEKLDFLISQIGEILSNSISLNDTLAHRSKNSEIGILDSNQFAILVEGVKDVVDVVKFARKIEKELKVAIKIDEEDIYLKYKIGISLFSDKYQSPNNIIMDASLVSKNPEHEWNTINIFDEKQYKDSLKKISMEMDINSAIDNDWLELNYQPIVRLRDGEISGLEVLVRMNHPTKGRLPPGEFISVAEESNLIIPMTQLIFKKVKQEVEEVIKEIKPRDLSFHINLSAKHFNNEQILEDVKLLIGDNQLEANNFSLEITESALAKDYNSVLKQIRELNKQGFEISLDDFGTEYSSLKYINDLKFHTLKIDRIFIDKVNASDKNNQLVELMITMAHKLNLKVIAEGIETREQRDILKGFGCEYGQGFLYSKPLTYKQMLDVL